MTKQLGLTVVVLAAFAAFMSIGTLAVFTDQEGVGSNAFSTGKVDLTVGTTSALVTYSNMMPGDATTSSLVLSSGTGSDSLRYAVSASATNADSKGLKDQLGLVIKTVDVTTPSSPCDNFDGTQLYSGDMDSTAGKLLGDNTQGSQTGDRTLAAQGTSGDSETLCFRVSLPSSTTNTHASASTTVTFTFDAEQTDNN